MTRSNIDVINRGRVRFGPMGSTDAEGLSGAFLFDGPCGKKLTVVAHDGLIDGRTGWEHVSVSTRNRCPNWEEMCFVKRLWWAPDEVVMQLHPAESEYVNVHEYVLHLWRPLEDAIPLPPTGLV